MMKQQARELLRLFYVQESGLPPIDQHRCVRRLLEQPLDQEPATSIRGLGV